MEYIIYNTDIFDQDIDEKLNKIITANKDNFNKDDVYRLKVSFSVKSLNNSKLEEFSIIGLNEIDKDRKKDKINDVMSFQLEKLEKILEKNDMKIFSSVIQGDLLEIDNIIKIEISEDNSEAFFYGRGKNKKRIKISSIVPNLEYTQETAKEYASESLGDIYCKLMSIIGNKKLMSDILGIDGTEDDSKLFNAFVEQYGDWWLTTNEQDKEMLNRFKQRLITVFNEYEN